MGNTPETDEQLYRRAYGRVEPDDPAYMQWIESDQFGDDADDSRVLYGKDAAEAGMAALAEALGGRENVEKVLAGRGRPSVGNSHANGRSPHRQVRFDSELDQKITSYAADNGQSISSVIRQAVADWFSQQPASKSTEAA